MPTRTRSQNNRSTLSGTCVLPDGYVYSQTVNIGNSKHMTDFVGNRDGVNDLDAYSDDFSSRFVNGTTYTAAGKKNREYTMYPIDRFYQTLSLPHPVATFGGMGFTRLQQYAWELLAKTNPSAPSVSVPQGLAELKDWKDLPRQIRENGRRVLRNAAMSNLLLRWAIRPLVSDVMALCNFADAVEKRRKLLDRLASGKRESRKVTLDRDTSKRDISGVFISQGITLRDTAHQVFNTKVWGSVSYKSSSTTSIPASDIERTRFARRLVAGYTGWGLVETAWELLPWSWFADWFSSLGDSIKALNNTIPITWSKVCIMRQTTCRSEARLQTQLPAGLTMVGKMKRERVWKERFVTIPFIPFVASMPALTSAQWSILGSLSILRTRPLRGQGNWIA